MYSLDLLGHLHSHVQCLRQRLLHPPLERTLGRHPKPLVILLIVLLQPTVPTIRHTRTVLAVIRLTIRVRDQVLTTGLTRKETLLAHRALVRLQPLVDVARVLQQVAGRREPLATLLAHVRLLLRVRPLVDPQIRLGRALVRTQVALEQLHCRVHGLVAGHRTGRLERLVARLTGKGPFTRVRA